MPLARTAMGADPGTVQTSPTARLAAPVAGGQLHGVDAGDGDGGGLARGDAGRGHGEVLVERLALDGRDADAEVRGSRGRPSAVGVGVGWPSGSARGWAARRRGAGRVLVGCRRRSARSAARSGVGCGSARGGRAGGLRGRRLDVGLPSGATVGSVAVPCGDVGAASRPGPRRGGDAASVAVEPFAVRRAADSVVAAPTWSTGRSAVGHGGGRLRRGRGPGSSCERHERQPATTAAAASRRRRRAADAWAPPGPCPGRAGRRAARPRSG